VGCKEPVPAFVLRSKFNLIFQQHDENANIPFEARAPIPVPDPLVKIKVAAADVPTVLSKTATPLVVVVDTAKVQAVNKKLNHVAKPRAGVIVSTADVEQARLSDSGKFSDFKRLGLYQVLWGLFAVSLIQ